jgi:uncharacterized protein (TIGR02246 family)
MSPQISTDAEPISSLYQALLDAWNRRDAAGFAALFDEDGNVIGFDGSQMNGQADIKATLRQIFDDHQTGRYVGIIREVRFLLPEVALLRAVSGIVPAGQSDLNPATNAIQSLVAVQKDGHWRIAHYQNTPAQFHGRPELVQQLTEELRELV